MTNFISRIQFLAAAPYTIENKPDLKGLPDKVLALSQVS